MYTNGASADGSALQASEDSIFFDEAFLSTPLGRALLSPTWARKQPWAKEADETLPPVLPTCRRFLQSEVGGTMERLSLVFVLLKDAQTRRVSESSNS